MVKICNVYIIIFTKSLDTKRPISNPTCTLNETGGLKKISTSQVNRKNVKWP